MFNNIPPPPLLEFPPANISQILHYLIISTLSPPLLLKFTLPDNSNIIPPFLHINTMTLKTHSFVGLTEILQHVVIDAPTSKATLCNKPFLLLFQ